MHEPIAHARLVDVPMLGVLHEKGLIAPVLVRFIPEAIMQIQYGIFQSALEEQYVGSRLFAAPEFLPSAEQISATDYALIQRRFPMKYPAARGFELPIFHSAYHLVVAVSERTKKFPKQDRYTTGERLWALGMDFLGLITKANAVRGDERKNLLIEASVTLDLFKIMLRPANDTKALPEKGYLDLAHQAREIGNQLGGWIKVS